MSPHLVVFVGLVVLVLCGSARGVTETGLQELTALDVVLRDLQGILVTHPQPGPLATLTEPLAGVWNASGNEGASTAEGVGSLSFLSSHVAVESDEQSGEAAPVRPSRRKKRVSPTPPPSRCPIVQLPEYLSKWEQLKYLVTAQMVGCHHHGDCCHRRPDPCPYKAEVLAARLALLEEQLREVDRLEARLKIHFTLLNSIQASVKYPGQPGERGPPGRKGHQGFKGLPGYSGGPGTCRITGQADPPSAGPPGPQGNKGNPGAPGDKVCGCDGDKGDPGSQGASRRGASGPRGLKGQKGGRGRDLPLFHG
ncbi:putative cuticle collagen 99 isoform X2 [Scylla paramamosain]